MSPYVFLYVPRPPPPPPPEIPTLGAKQVPAAIPLFFLCVQHVGWASAGGPVGLFSCEYFWNIVSLVSQEEGGGMSSPHTLRHTYKKWLKPPGRTIYLWYVEYNEKKKTGNKKSENYY
jgi:hypothetical protein